MAIENLWTNVLKGTPLRKKDRMIRSAYVPVAVV